MVSEKTKCALVIDLSSEGLSVWRVAKSKVDRNTDCLSYGNTGSYFIEATLTVPVRVHVDGLTNAARHETKYLMLGLSHLPRIENIILKHVQA